MSSPMTREDLLRRVTGSFCNLVNAESSGNGPRVALRLS